MGGEKFVKVVKDRIQGGMDMRLDDEGIVNKSRPTFGIWMEIV
jgi:hypothetical protein